MGSQLVDTIKEVVDGKMNADDLTDFMYGTVESTSPLKIGIDTDKKLSLTGEFLVLTKNVTDHEIEMQMEWTTETADGHTHEVTGKKKIKVLNGLKSGDKVVMIRQHGGQKYLIIDKIGGA